MFVVTPVEEVSAGVVLIGVVVQNLRRRFKLWRGKHNRDPQRLFSTPQKREIFSACQYRCEYPRLILGRCKHKATQADHVFPWSLGGRTEVSNGAGLCARHNQHKSNHIPSGRYMRALKRNRARQARAKISVK